MSELEHKETMQALTLPTMALRGITVFPSMLLHFDVGRQTSIKALDQAVELGSYLFLIPQKDLSVDDPELSDLYSIGTIAAVRQVLRLPGDNIRVMVEGIARARAIECWQDKPFFVMQVEQIPPAEKTTNSVRAEAVIRITYDLIQRYCELSPKTSSDVLLTVVDSKNPGYMADYMAQNLSIRGEDKQTILEELRPVRRLEKMNRILRREIQVLEIERDLETKVKEQVSQNQKDYYLREQLKAIQSELGDSGDGMDEIAEYEQKINAAKLPKEVDAKLRKELTRLSKQPYSSAEASVLRNYLDVCLELPWTVRTKERLNVEAARKVLDADHYGLEKVKERILEFLAVRTAGAGPARARSSAWWALPAWARPPSPCSMAKAMNRKHGPHLPGRRPRRGGHPRPPQDLYRRHARPHHRRHQAGGQQQPADAAGRDRQAGQLTTAATRPRRCWRCWTRSRTPPSATTIWRCPSTCPRCCSSPRPTRPEHHPRARCWTVWRSSSCPATPMRRSSRLPGAICCPVQMKRHGLNGRSLRVTDGAIREIIDRLYPRVRRSHCWSGSWRLLCRKAAMELVDYARQSESPSTGTTWSTSWASAATIRTKLDHSPSGGLSQRPGLDLVWAARLLEVEVNVVDGTGKLELTGNLGDVMKESGHAAITYIRCPAPVSWTSTRSFYQEQGYPHPFPGGRRAQGRPLRRRDHHHRHGLRSDRHAGAG